MGWTDESRPPDVLLHYSEDGSIASFEPHVPRTNPTHSPAVWTIDAARAPLYWFPRDCPRVTVWANDDEQQHRMQQCFATTATRVHAVPLAWLDATRECRLYEYRFDPAPFSSWPEAEGQWIAYEPVTPTAVGALGDLLDLHVVAGIELRFVPDLMSMRNAVLASGLPFSIVRYRT